MKSLKIETKKPLATGNVDVDNQATASLSSKEKRLHQRRRIEEIMEAKKLREYVDDFDYYFE
jgi:hypothetical protein